jgi:replicative DNA helicase
MPRSETEDRLLGALLQDSTLLDSGRVTLELFQGRDARETFKVMRGLREAGRPLCRATLFDAIGERVPPSYLSDVSDAMPTGANAEYYLKRLVEQRQRAELGRVTEWLTEYCSQRVRQRSMRLS